LDAGEGVEAALLEGVRDWCRRRLTPELLKRVDREHEFPFELYREMGRLGWLGLPFPPRYGGGGGGLLTMLRLVEELSHGALAAGNLYFRNVVNGGMNILRSGSEEQKERLLGGLARGELRFAFAMTEPDAGSDVAAMRTRAQEVEGGFLLRGTKTWITGAAEADYLQLYARSGDGSRDVSVFMVDARSDGISFQEIPKLGNNAMRSYSVALEDVLVPGSALLGRLHGGWDHALAALDLERVAVSLECVGAAQRCVEEAVAYAAERVQFGRPIAGFQSMRHHLADMQTKVVTARCLAYHAASLIAEGRRAAAESAMSKLHSGEVYFEVAINAMQVFGGYGYALEYPAERHLRDASLYRIVPGPHVLRNAIAREMGVSAPAPARPPRRP
jgi:alkylation response protein AidB-like acyl-CoA dehydrogenase